MDERKSVDDHVSEFPLSLGSRSGYLYVSCCGRPTVTLSTAHEGEAGDSEEDKVRMHCFALDPFVNTTAWRLQGVIHFSL
jgi:hypothetical protein